MYFIFPSVSYRFETRNHILTKDWRFKVLWNRQLRGILETSEKGSDKSLEK
jgi:hypothetical protein